MPLLYKEIPLWTSGMICAERFDLPGDGRKVFFNINPGGTFRKDIFIVQDGKFRADAFANGSRLETPVNGLERLLRNPHEAFAIVVDRTEVHLDPIDLPLTPIPVSFCSGRNSAVEISGTLNATIFPGDPALLARDFADGIVSDPIQTAAGTMKNIVLRAAASVIPAAMGREGAIRTAGQMDAICLELARVVQEQTELALPWCRVTGCDVELTIQNMDKLLDDSNFLDDLRVETQRKLLDAILTTFGSSPLPAEVSQVLMAYIQANPGLPPGEIKDFCQGLHAIWQRTSPAALLAAASQVGLLPAPKGGSR